MAKDSKMPSIDDSKPPGPPRRSSDSTNTISNTPTAPSSQNGTASTSRGGTTSPTGRDDDVTGPSPITPLTSSPGINPATPPQAPLSTFSDSAPASQGMQPDISPRKLIMSRGAPGAIIDDGLGFFAPTNQSNTPAVVPADNVEPIPPAAPRPSFSLPIRLARQHVHSQENENYSGRQNSISGDTGALPVQNPDEVEDGGPIAWCHSVCIMHHCAWRAALDPAAYGKLMRQLGMPNTPSETEHQANEQLGSSDTLEGNPPQLQNPTSGYSPGGSLFGKLRGEGYPNSPSGPRPSMFGNSGSPPIQPNPNLNINLNPSTGQVSLSDREAFEELLQSLASQEAAQQTSRSPEEGKGEDDDAEGGEE
jgi:hypothetical protein